MCSKNQGGNWLAQVCLESFRYDGMCVCVVYGCGRPSTPIHEVLEFKYQDDWIERQRCIQSARLLKAQTTVRDNHLNRTLKPLFQFGPYFYVSNICY